MQLYIIILEFAHVYAEGWGWNITNSRSRNQSLCTWVKVFLPGLFMGPLAVEPGSIPTEWLTLSPFHWWDVLVSLDVGKGVWLVLPALNAPGFIDSPWEALPFLRSGWGWVRKKGRRGKLWWYVKWILKSTWENKKNTNSQFAVLHRKTLIQQTYERTSTHCSFRGLLWFPVPTYNSTPQPLTTASRDQAPLGSESRCTHIQTDRQTNTIIKINQNQSPHFSLLT